MRDLMLGWTERDDVARWFQNDLQFCGDVVPGDAVDHRRKVAALGERFVAATPTEAAATVAELAGLSVDLSRRVRATLRSNPRSFRDQAVAKHCQQVWTTVAAAVEAYERYAKDARCRDSSDNCMTKLDESARADKSARRLALPLGWEDRWDVDSFLNEDLRFCLFVINDGQRGAVKEAYTARLRSGQFTKHSAGPVEEVAAGVREYRELAYRMKLRFETLAKGAE